MKTGNYFVKTVINMCTALSFCCKEHYFGRNLDLDRSYGEEVCVMPRSFPIELRCGGKIDSHYAMIGMATVAGDTPLFYDATNEYGLSMAGLNFPQNACYYPVKDNMDNITPFELIPYILGKCKTVADVSELLKNINVVNIPFSESLPLSPLHWIISDSKESVVVECMADGMHIHANPVGVLTNNPPFPYHIFNLNNYRALSASNPENRFLKDIEPQNYCLGLGALGLPGDVSSMSRFVRAVFTKTNSVCETDESSAVGQFFHILSSVEMTKGVCKTETGENDITVYSSCINTKRGLYYYTTYENRRISCVDMHKTDLNGDKISRYPLIASQQIFMQN